MRKEGCGLGKLGFRPFGRSTRAGMDIRGFRARPIYTSAQMLEYVGKTATLCHNSGHGTVIKGWSKLLRMSHRNKRIRDQFGVFGESKKPSGTGRAKTAMGVWRDVHYELSEVSGALSFAQFEHCAGVGGRR